ncbi:MAG: hypothetical protein JW734_08960 [Candidatus Omnitrophica bacterium]|nr:hypothetical protein [Candidatus Omnitrophota bacterium]
MLTSSALIFISYHPGSLIEYEQIKNKQPKKKANILIICDHPYLNQEIIDLYSKRFDRVIILPLIRYQPNILSGFFRLWRFHKLFRKEIASILEAISEYDIISDCSAYLPVNVLISELRRDVKFKRLVSIRQDRRYNLDIDIFRTALAFIYIFFFRLSLVWVHRVHKYTYCREPRDEIILFRDKFFEKHLSKEVKPRSAPVAYLTWPLRSRGSFEDTVIFYSDIDFRSDASILSEEEFRKRLMIFFKKFAEVYKNCRIICKPHPSNIRGILPGLEQVKYELYQGGLISQMHLEQLIRNVRACYSISSTSLLYSAQRGIASYAMYKYLGFGGIYPRVYFETDFVKDNPFLYALTSIEEIAAIDSLDAESALRERAISYTAKKE